VKERAPGGSRTYVVHFPAFLLPEVTADEGRSHDRQRPGATELDRLAAEDRQQSTPEQHQHPERHYEGLQH